MQQVHLTASAIPVHTEGKTPREAAQTGMQLNSFIITVQSFNVKLNQQYRRASPAVRNTKKGIAGINQTMPFYC